MVDGLFLPGLGTGDAHEDEVDPSLGGLRECDGCLAFALLVGALYIISTGQGGVVHYVPVDVLHLDWHAADLVVLILVHIDAEVHFVVCLGSLRPLADPAVIDKSSFAIVKHLFLGVQQEVTLPAEPHAHVFLLRECDLGLHVLGGCRLLFVLDFHSVCVFELKTVGNGF